MSERKRDYPTGSKNGMEFIANRWVYAGSQGDAHEYAASLAKTTPHPKEGQA